MRARSAVSGAWSDPEVQPRVTVSHHPISKARGLDHRDAAQTADKFSRERLSQVPGLRARTRKGPERAATEVVPSRGFRLPTALAGSGAAVPRTSLAGHSQGGGTFHHLSVMPSSAPLWGSRQPSDRPSQRIPPVFFPVRQGRILAVAGVHTEPLRGSARPPSSPCGFLSGGESCFSSA